jgi:hypothetical protein
MTKKPISKMTNAELLDEFSRYERHAGDDFSIHPFTESDCRRSEKMRAEVLRRMNAGHQSCTLSRPQGAMTKDADE